MAARQYSSTAPEMTLQSSVTNANTTFTVDTVAGLPGAYPFTVVIDFGVSGEEICSVTNVAALSLTVTRGQDGTTATSHSAGAKLRHMMTARDLSEPQVHIAASAAVHGLAGTVVGTTDTQTLTNKTISGSSNTITNVSGANITGANNVAKGVLPTDTIYNANVATMTNKTLTSPVINTPTGIVKGDVALGNVDNTSDATKNAASVTLTNKTISGASNTLTNIGNSSLSTGIDAGKVASVASSFVPKTALPTDTQYRTDSGVLTAGSCMTASGGWSDTGSTIRTVNGVTFLTVSLQRTGAAITANVTSGDIADTTMANITPAVAPAVAAYGAARQGGSALMIRIDSSGNVVVYSSIPGVDIATGNTVLGSMTWM